LAMADGEWQLRVLSPRAVSAPWWWQTPAIPAI
jgi:hypothetical protein